MSEDHAGTLLELAAADDLQAFKQQVNLHPSLVDAVDTWYIRHRSSSQMLLQHLTPFMVASIYGSLNILKLIISFPEIDVNQICGPDKSTALHCAASSGSPNAADIIKLLLSAGADPSTTDANGRRPIDTIFISPNLKSTKPTLQILLATDDSDSKPSPDTIAPPTPTPPEKKEYPIDPSLPDIKNSLYSTDEFRMFSFKVRPCSRAYSHDWTECPFVHPGENARRRDPRKYHYSCVPCPDFRKTACRRGDMCEYAHGVFECWLHPAQYRTRLCKDGTTCNRRVCFFAHMQEELRPLYISTGSAVPSPSFTPPMSPSSNSVSPNSCILGQQNVPSLHLQGSSSSLQLSRLRLSLNARDMEKTYFHPKPLTQSNLDDIFSPEGSNSPRLSDFSPTQKLTVYNQLLSPIKTSFSPRNMDYSQLPFRNPDPVSPMSARVSMVTQQERFQSLSSRDLFSSASLEENWAEWGVTDDELCSFENLNDGDEDEPDLSWVQSLVKDSPQDLKEKYGTCDVGDSTAAGEGVEDPSVLGAWLEQMQLDQLMAQ